MTNIALSSKDATYKINGEILTDSTHKSGNYYQYNKWDITNYFNETKKTELLAIGNAGDYGVSYKNALSVLTAKEVVVEASLSVSTERKNSNIDIVYPGTYNNITIAINTNKNGKYKVQLLADGVIINETNVTITSNSGKISVIVDTIRQINSSTAYVSGQYNTVNYTAKLFLDDELINQTAIKAGILYNGYFNKELSYPGPDYASFYNETITGDMVVDVLDSSYASKMENVTGDWNVILPADSDFVKAFIYVAYSSIAGDNENMFNVTFNGDKLSSCAFMRDQANVISTSGYGVIVYDVSGLIKSGVNNFTLNKTITGGVYSPVLVYLYNTTGSSVVKNVYITNGVDLVGTYGNGAGRIIQVNTTLNINSSDIDGAVAYILGAGSTKGRATISVNGELDSDVWDDPASSINIYKKDISNSISDVNNVSITLKNSMFVTLPQIIVTTKLDNVTGNVSIKTERQNSNKDIVYAGTFNLIYVNVTVTKTNNYVVRLLADGKIVNSTEIKLTGGETKIVQLIDPTIRNIDENTTYGHNNKNVTYTAELLLSDGLVNNSSLDALILYNGYLNKELGYPGSDFESFYNGAITGDIVIDVSEKAYAGGVNNRTDNWTVILPDNSNFVKAWVYVAYCYGGADTSALFNVSFNGVMPSVVSFKRDQANIVSTSGYGLIVYDVSDLIKSGVNTFVLNKTHSTGAYPSTLIYLYNTSSSNVVKNVYISNGADLVGVTGNDAGRVIQVNTTLNVNSSDIDGAVAYIFGAGSVKGRAAISVNGELDSDVWDDSSDSINIYKKDISNSVSDVNNVSITLKDKMFTALQQIIVTSKVIPLDTKITAPAVTTTYNINNNLIVTLTDSNGKVVSNAQVTIVLNGASNIVTTDANGQAILAIPSNLVPKTYAVSISYAGDGTHLKSSADTSVVVKKATPKLTASKKTFKVKAKSKKYTITLKNNVKKVLKKVKVTIKVKGKTYKATTSSKGKATFNLKKLTKKGKYDAVVKFAGNKYYNSISKKVKITIK